MAIMRSFSMKNSEQNPSSEKILATIINLLNEERVVREIDEPIDMTVKAFRLKVKVPLSHSDFNRVIAGFVRNIYQKGLRLSRHLSNQEALTEAVSLLEKYYQGIDSRGYDGALLDARGNDQEGLEYVLSQLAESIKAVERKKYVQWIFSSIVDQSDWEARRRIAATYLIQYKDILSPELRDMDPAWLADHFQGLILNLVSTQSFLRQVSGSDVSSF
jgi:hypothetical protein